jgi:endo-1,4-beta-xylanase
MDRYRGVMDRWDVVSRPLTTFGGTGRSATSSTIGSGPTTLEKRSGIARDADTQAGLFLKENLVEALSVKRQELLELVRDMVSRGVPIDGVALQMHEMQVGPPPGARPTSGDYTALGLEVTIAEPDVHILDPIHQAVVYGDVESEALAAGITGISV